MSNGLGAGFAGLTLLAVLLGLAVLLVVTLVGVFLYGRRAEPVPRLLPYLSVVVLVGVILIAGFGVVALYDEALPLAVLFLAIVLVPLAAVGGAVQLTTDLGPIDALATTGLAWSLPFIVGVAVTAGLTIGLGSALGLPPAGSRQQTLVWLATAVGGIVVVAGSILLARNVGRSVSGVTPE